MASERTQLVGDVRSAADQPTDNAGEPRPLFGNKIRSTLDEVRELRARRRGDGQLEESGNRPLFGNQIREARREIAGFLERRRVARNIPYGD